jgi:hypothetical protein
MTMDWGLAQDYAARNVRRKNLVDRRQIVAAADADRC